VDCLIHLLGRDGLAGIENPDSLFLSQSSPSAQGTQNNLIFRFLNREGIARSQPHFIAYRLGQDDSAGFVDRQSSHVDIIEWYLPFKNGIL
jgi:hypothetical protein